MEQLLFKSGIEKLSSEYLVTLSVDYGDLNEQAEKQILDSYQSGLKKGLELMQEFDKWKAKNDWEYDYGINRYVFESTESNYFEAKSFSELFEIFEKETTK